jgi:hypothetical protein
MRVMAMGFLLLAAPAVAADIDGRWSGTMVTPMGDFPIAFVFKADGDKLTGAMIGMDGAEFPIANGKIEGNNISYTVTLDFGGMALEFTYKGVLTGTELKLNGTVFDMPFELVVRKVT